MTPQKYTMPKDKAESIVASLLAINTAGWHETIKVDATLAPMAREMIARNRDVAIALGIDDEYSAKLATHLS